MRAEQQAAFDGECILHLARRMVRRKVQRLEVVEVVLDVLGPLDFESHRHEDIEHPF
jgi:hypothetical protein